MKIECSNQHKLFTIKGDEVRVGPCKVPATTRRDSWRFGQNDEPAIIKVRVPLCADCARAWDENRAEAKAEAAVS